MIALVIAGDGLLLASGTVARRQELRLARERLSSGLIDTSRQLSTLQRESDSSRQVIVEAMDAMNELLNLARHSEGIEQAAASFPMVASQMDVARRANLRISDQTSQLLAAAKNGRNSIADLLVVTKSANERGYLQALDNAIALLIQTHEMYAGVNSQISDLMIRYEELFRIADDFIKERSSFRTTREAARVLDARTGKLIIEVTQSRAAMNSTQAQAEALAAKTTEAFLEARRFDR